MNEVYFGTGGIEKFKDKIIVLKLTDEDISRLNKDDNNSLFLAWFELEIFKALENDAIINNDIDLASVGIRMPLKKYLYGLAVKYLDTEKIEKLHREYINEFLETVELERNDDNQSFFFRLTMPQVAEKVLISIKRKTRFHLIENIGDMIDTFIDGSLRINEDLFRTKEREVTEDMSVEEMEDILYSETLVQLLESIFAYYRSVIKRYKGEYEESENILKEQLEHAKLQLQSYRNQKGREWRKPLLESAKEIYINKEYTDKTKALKEAFENMPQEYKAKYSDKYYEEELAIIRQFQRKV
ncbi:MAG: hypothetical protein L3J41_15820 [Melioribacteraceae bacterium]|nr:hypothetical protein [Melioribacteraceae bacterium]